MIAINSLLYSLDGSPWCKIVAKSTVNVNCLNYSLVGMPWWGMYGYSSIQPALGHIKAVNQVDWAKVKKFNGVSQANIKTIINVEG